MSQFVRKDYEFNWRNYMEPDRHTWNHDKLAAEARKMAKRANQRMVRLEKSDLTSSPAYRGAVKAASGLYSKEEVNWAHVDKTGRPRFKERTAGLSTEELLQELYSLEKTISAKTSTVGGVKKVYSQAQKNMQANLGPLAPNLSLDDIMYVMRSEALTAAMGMFGYRAVLQMVSDMQSKHKHMPIEKIADEVASACEKGENLGDAEKILGIEKEEKIKDDKWIPSV